MSENQAIIRKLTAVETLGCTQVICSDKTGTLTQNKMTVVEHAGADVSRLALAMALCSDAELDGEDQPVGEPTECALVADALQQGISKREYALRYPRVGEAPFDSGRKMMSTLHRTPEGDILQFTKGAPDQVLERCTSYYEKGQELPMTEEKRQEILSANKAMADQALRVLLGAQRRWETMPEDLGPETLERELCYLGLSGMIDPIRPEVKTAIGDCKRAGIRPIMITGDHRDTAVAIAKSLGILRPDQRAITGMELNELSDQELLDHIEEFSVYARVQPEHKVRIVKAWKQKGYITAMTGDGVNDAPSIKAADIGVGMGITGTDVTKNVADMVLADDNFATIVSAVAEGRRIYDNIRKAIGFLLASNLAEVLSVFLATLLGFTILEPVHLLWINLITDCFPALALGLERGEQDIMERQPRSASEGVFAGGLGLDVALQGLVVTAITLVSYFLGHYLEAGAFEIVNSPDGMTMAFLTLSMVEIFHSFNMRSRRKSLFSLRSHNGWLWGAMALSLVLTTAVIYVPFLSTAFGFQEISLMEYVVALSLAVSIIPIMELAKLVLRKLGK
jgi:Ca2+-transporting ATPase